MYDIIVIGAGSGGLNIASFMNKAGFKTLLVDKSDESIGGDCLNFGCVPSKALLHTAKITHNARKATEFGINVSGSVDMRKVTDYIRSSQETIRVHENADYFRQKGMDVELGDVKFISKNSVSVNGKNFSAKKIILATGSRPRKLNIPGINKIKYYDNENIFNIPTLPKKLLVIGGGPIGIEIGQAFLRLGSSVTVVQMEDKFLPKEVAEIADVLYSRLKSEGMSFMFNSIPKEFSGAHEVIISDKGQKEEKKLQFDAVFFAVGRILNIEDLNLDSAGIKHDERKIVVDPYLRTTNKNVLLCGDIAGGYQFTHTAELHARVIISNFFSPFKKKLNYSNFSWVTFTDPEIATFGYPESVLNEKKIQFDKISVDFTEDDRAIVDDYQYAKGVLYVSKDKLLGGTIISPNAGEIFQELILVKSAGLKLKSIFNKIYPYPTASRINKRFVSSVYSKKLNDLSKKILHMLYK